MLVERVKLQWVAHNNMLTNFACFVVSIVSQWHGRRWRDEQRRNGWWHGWRNEQRRNGRVRMTVLFYLYLCVMVVVDTCCEELDLA